MVAPFTFNIGTLQACSGEELGDPERGFGDLYTALFGMGEGGRKYRLSGALQRRDSGLRLSRSDPQLGLNTSEGAFRWPVETFADA